MQEVSTSIDVTLMSLCCYERENWSHHQQEIVCADCGATVDPNPPPEAIADALSLLNPDALLLEPREAFDKALVGMTKAPEDKWPRKTETLVAVYDYFECITAHLSCGLPTWEAAVEWMEYNTVGAWVGENTPTFRVREG
jgi:hypothetical protein